MDYSLYFETLSRIQCEVIPEWAIGLAYALIGTMIISWLLCVIFAVYKNCKPMLVAIFLIIIVLCLCGTAILLTTNPRVKTDEYRYEAEVTESFNLSEFENDGRFTNIEYSNGKLKFKSYEYIEEID